MAMRCPVLEFTPAAQRVLALFEACYGIAVGDMGSVRWVRQALPAAGGAGEQDAKTMQALRYVADLQQDELATTVQRMRATRREVEA